MRVRIATCAQLPEPDVDEDLLLDALRTRGVDAEMAAWDDPDEAWSEAVPTVLRSTWNYIHDLGKFLAWADAAAHVAPLWNPPEVVRWNAHKSYLAELADRRCAVVPTEFFTRGSQVDLAAELRAHDFHDIVIKPTVSAGSFGTRRFADAAGDRADAQRFLDELLVERDAMVQAYLPSVEDYGERSLVWIDGDFTHAIRKSPRFTGQDESVTGPLPIADDERALAERVLAPWADRLLYARVDLARGPEKRPMIMELELIEPSLFLLQHRPALDRLVEGIARRLGVPSAS
jgi:glutathione synthase/RimK-type ligase-like ATP-grasp enzyme